MELNKLSFPVKITLEEAILLFQKEFDKKGHKVKITKDKIHLNITPFWVCFYDIDCKTDGKYQHISAQTALNSLTNKVEDEFLKLLDVSTPKIIEDLDISFEKVEIRIKKSLVKKEEAKETITKMLSCKFSVEKNNISLSGFEEIYMPIWRCDIENMEIYFDGVTSKINNFNKIEKKQKNNREIFSEMLKDIKSPKKFFEYLFNLIVGVFKALFTTVKFLIKNWYFTLIIILAIAIIIVVLF
ncbi:MAG TPA: hypothetical protein PLK55_02445 [archaeon]|jgi:hypothetical protein|nr:hypothetical protein [archaeon]